MQGFMDCLYAKSSFHIKIQFSQINFLKVERLKVD